VASGFFVEKINAASDSAPVNRGASSVCQPCPEPVACRDQLCLRRLLTVKAGDENSQQPVGGPIGIDSQNVEPLRPRLELTPFGGHLILDVCPGEGGPDGSSIEVSRGVPA